MSHENASVVDTDAVINQTPNQEAAIEQSAFKAAAEIKAEKETISNINKDRFTRLKEV